LRFGAVDSWEPDLLKLAIENMFYVPKINTEPVIPIGKEDEKASSSRDIRVLILGAWGCGAFGCPTEEMAELFCKTMQETNCMRLYDEVHFAIPAMDNGDNHTGYLNVMQKYFGKFDGKKGVMIREVQREKAAANQNGGVTLV
jgi:hypothetical protein